MTSKPNWAWKIQLRLAVRMQDAGVSGAGRKTPANQSSNRLTVQISICWESLQDLKGKSNMNTRPPTKTATNDGIADTGCSILCEGENLRKESGIDKSMLLRSNLSLGVADGRKLTIIGALPIQVSTTGSRICTTKQILHIVSELADLYLSKACLAE